MTPQQLKAMKMALEALELLTGAWQTFDALDYGDNAITAIKKVLAEHAMRETQRLGQEIEQEPVAHCKVRPLRGDESFPKVEIDWVNQPVPGPLYTAPPQRKPLSAEQVSEICAEWTDENGNTSSFGRRQIARAIEAAHGIKGDA